MSEDMLSKTLVRELPGLMRDFTKKVLGPGGLEWLQGFKLFLKKQNPWPVIPTAQTIAKAVSDLLRFVKEVKLPAIATFLVKDHIKVGEIEGVKIGYVSEDFTREFGSKVENEVAEATLKIHQLKKNSVDSPIIAELGGETVVETTIGQMFEMMKKQGRGQRGNLLTNGYANIFYAQNASGVPWAVSCYCYSVSGDWSVFAIPVTYPNLWYEGRRVFSRDSGS